MILNQKTEEEFGYNFSDAKMADNIYCQCDYCGVEYKRSKRNIIVSNKVIDKDACGGQCTVAKRKESNLKTYGSDNYFKTDVFKEKSKQTMFEKYGVDNASKSKDIRNKIEETCQHRYGNKSYLGSEHVKKLNLPNPMESEAVKEKIKQTCLKKHGVEYASQSDAVKQKVKQTCLEKYGVENPSQNSKIVSKIKQTNLKRYGAETILQMPEFHANMIQKCKEKYGVDHPSHAEEVKDKRRATCLEKYGVDHISQLLDTQQKIAKTKIERYGTVNVNFTKSEFEIKDWLNQFGFSFKKDVVGGKEIDMVDWDLKIGVEFCGLYWHTELSPEPRHRSYHYKKYKSCLENGIQLITIFQDEWANRKSQCKNFIKGLLGIHERRIYARKCIIKPIEKTIFNEFCDLYHVIGSCNLAKYCYGLFHEDEILGVLSLGNHHRQDGLVLNRLCFIDNVQVIGGASKLFKYAIQRVEFDKIISWSDNRWSCGKIYEVLGFKLEKDLGPDYSYVNLKSTKRRYSKQSFKKSVKGIPETITEKEWCAERGFARIWDCGKKRWIFNFEN